MPTTAKVISTLVKDHIIKNDVMVFAKSYCPYCSRVRSELKKNNIVFDAIDLDTREQNDGSEIQAYLLEITGQRTVPNVFANGHHVGGCDETLKALSNGTFKKLLEGPAGKFRPKPTEKPEAKAPVPDQQGAAM
ncbi:Glutaredoxin [Coemansia guatemalensis]|uniref:Glutaredoxin n=1 Tax=Coemansia guatemalensis TaxID=2761395 RepID=A0A9W8LX02_9FUNG|nr:Glutaredoxin [Coemansia guatemalensis]